MTKHYLWVYFILYLGNRFDATNTTVALDSFDCTWSDTPIAVDSLQQLGNLKLLELAKVIEERFLSFYAQKLI